MLSWAATRSGSNTLLSWLTKTLTHIQWSLDPRIFLLYTSLKSHKREYPMAYDSKNIKVNLSCVTFPPIHQLAWRTFPLAIYLKISKIFALLTFWNLRRMMWDWVKKMYFLISVEMLAMAKVKSWCLMYKSQVGIVAVKDGRAWVAIRMSKWFFL